MAGNTEEPNLWTTLLRESSKKVITPDTTIIVVGNKTAGKKHLIDKLSGHTIKTKPLDIENILTYSFFDVDESLSERISRINVWSFGESTRVFEKAAEIISNKSSVSDRVIYLWY